MHDFVPEDMFNFLLESRQNVYFGETISHKTPTKIKGAYYVMGGSPDKVISCIVYDPQRDIIYKRKGSAQGIILFDTTIEGEYVFMFKNSQSIDMTITFALHTFEEREEEIAFDIDEDGNRFVKESPSQSADNILSEEDMAANKNEIQVVNKKLSET